MEIKITERRRPRIEAKLKVSEKGKPDIIETFIGNISQTGIFLETPKPFAKSGDKLELFLKLPNSRERIRVTGKVVRIVGPNQLGKTKGIGIELLKIEAKQTYLFNRFLEELIEANGMGCRKSPRICTRLTVEFSTSKEMGKCLAGNLCKNGIFLQTDAKLSLGQKVRVAIIHPEKKESIEISGEIVHIRKNLKTEAKKNLSKGVGIKFINLTKMKETRINQFLRQTLIKRKSRKRKSKT